MNNLSELTNYEKINVSTKDVGLTEEQIIELHIAGVDTIGLIIASEEYILAELTGIKLDTARAIKEKVNQSGAALIVPKNDIGEEDSTYDFDDPYELLITVIQDEIFRYHNEYKQKTGINIALSALETLDISADLFSRLNDVNQSDSRAMLLSFPTRNILDVYDDLYQKEFDIKLILDFRKYVCLTTGMPRELYELLDKYEFMRRLFEKIQ